MRFQSWWTSPLGDVTDSTVKRSSVPLTPSHSDVPRPSVIGTVTHVQALRAYNRRLVEASVEEHQ